MLLRIMARDPSRAQNETKVLEQIVDNRPTIVVNDPQGILPA